MTWILLYGGVMKVIKLTSTEFNCVWYVFDFVPEGIAIVRADVYPTRGDIISLLDTLTYYCSYTFMNLTSNDPIPVTSAGYEQIAEVCIKDNKCNKIEVSFILKFKDIVSLINYLESRDLMNKWIVS